MINHKKTFDSYGVQLGALARIRRERRMKVYNYIGKLLGDIAITLVALYIFLLIANIISR